MTEEQLKTYHGIICDIWTLIKKYSKVPEIGSENFLLYWEYFKKDQQILIKKYNNAEFVLKILWDIEDEVNRITMGKILEEHKKSSKDIEPDGLEAIPAGKEASDENH